MEFVPAVAMIALILKVVDLLKGITNKDRNAVSTILATWIAAVVAVALYAQTTWAGALEFGGQTLDKMNWASVLALGLGLGASAGATFDFKKALDNSDSAKTPPLVPNGD